MFPPRSARLPARWNSAAGLVSTNGAVVGGALVAPSLEGAGNFVLSGSIQGTGGLVMNGTGTLLLSETT